MFARLTLQKTRAVLNRHPWVYTGAVQSIPQDIPDGAIVQVCDESNAVLGYGHFAPTSQIVCRMFEFNSNVQIDNNYWLQKLATAYSIRESRIHETNAFRLLNAEGDYLPGAVIDIYNDLAVLQLRTIGACSLLPIFVQFLTEQLNIQHIFDRTDGATTEWVCGNKPETYFQEYGINYKVTPSLGQKTGFFLDQRENRQLVRSLAKGRTVLDAFCYNGGFSMNALVGNATEVLAVDISALACYEAQANFEFNYKDKTNFVTQTGDCFEVLRATPNDYYDLIVLDPPAFTKHISTVQKAARGYKDINMKAFNKIKKGGLLFTFSCSQHISSTLFRQIVYSAAADSRRSVQVLKQLGHAYDHPVDIYHPEGEYLKGLLLLVN